MQLSPRTIAAGVLILIVVAVAVGANAGTVPKPQAYYRTGETSQAVWLTNLEETEVLRLRNVRPGSYVVTAVVAVRSNLNLIVNCWVLAEAEGGGIFVTGQTRLGAQTHGEIVLNAAGTLPDSQPIFVYCRPQGGDASATVRGITAQRVSALVIQSP